MVSNRTGCYRAFVFCVEIRKDEQGECCFTRPFLLEEGFRFCHGTMFICASGGAVYSVLGIKGRLDPLCTQSVVDFGYKELLYEC